MPQASRRPDAARKAKPANAEPRLIKLSNSITHQTISFDVLSILIKLRHGKGKAEGQLEPKAYRGAPGEAREHYDSSHQTISFDISSILIMLHNGKGNAAGQPEPEAGRGTQGEACERCGQTHQTIKFDHSSNYQL